ncbi:hybrid sensor histidine kinase/response regulator [bacterium]|nr:hybrid sensor histidine kinase/response regulator [bacterium]
MDTEKLIYTPEKPGYGSLPAMEVGPGKKILVVDDEEDIVELLSYHLNRKKFDVIPAFTGEQAVNLAEIEVPDLIILDYMLPILSGPDVSKILKGSPITRDIPIIFLTARSDSESIIKGLKTGACDYITKPANMVELMARIETQLLLKDALDRLKKTENDLRRANAAKDKFFTVFMHDLRAPFHSMSGFIHRLHQRYDKIDETERRRIIDTIEQSSVQIRKLLQNLLQWSCLQTGLFDWQPERIFLQPLVMEMQSLHAIQIASRNITVEISIHNSTTVIADVNMLESILRNLLQNAIKFTPDHGCIRIDSRSLGDVEEIRVSDTGIGIQETHLQKIFNLESCHSTAGLNGEKGSGLGLILCKEFVEKCGGTISAASVPGKGTDFIFTLPRSHEVKHS